MTVNGELLSSLLYLLVTLIPRRSEMFVILMIYRFLATLDYGSAYDRILRFRLGPVPTLRAMASLSDLLEQLIHHRYEGW